MGVLARAVGVFERVVGVFALVPGGTYCLDVLPLEALTVEGELERVDSALLEFGGLFTFLMEMGRREAGDTPRACRDLSIDWFDGILGVLLVG